jgi:hypothetical protein
VLKWSGTAACLLIVALWFASRWLGLHSLYVGATTKYQLSAMQGGLLIAWEDRLPESRSRSGWFAWTELHNDAWLRTWYWSFRYVNAPLGPGAGLYKHVVVPLYVVLLLIAAPVAYLHWRDRRRARGGYCPACGYDLAGLPAAAACPECGPARTKEHWPAQSG